MNKEEKMLGVMVDCSRNGVLTVQSVKKLATILRKLGYNTLMLYTEDTYEIDNQPYFGHLRGRYTKDELKEMDAFCVDIGIELIPCIQVLAHLDGIFMWPGEYGDIRDCDNILLIDDEKSDKLIEAMLATISECFTSRKIHIGMDEANKVGLGKYLQKHGYTDRFELINSHLHKVCKMAEKYNFEPMIWNDMFYKLALGKGNHYDVADAEEIRKKSALPENISLVYWDYSSKDTDHYIARINANKMFGRKVYYAGSVKTALTFTPANNAAIQCNKAAIDACKKCDIDGILLTSWGDDGAECSTFAALPAYVYLAEYAKGNTDETTIKAKFKEIVGCNYDDFMLFEQLDFYDKRHWIIHGKRLLYNDMFMGISDSYAEFSDKEHYIEMTKKLRAVTEKGEYGYLFDFYTALADALSIKATLGIRTRKAYLENDICELKAIVADCEALDEKLRTLHKTLQNRWFADNKPYGSEIQDGRLGALILRIQACKDRLLDYIDGKIDEIPELCEPVLEKDSGHHFWNRLISVNKMAGFEVM